MALRAFSSLLLACALGAGIACDATIDPLVIRPNCPDYPIRGPSEVAAGESEERMISDFEADVNSSNLPLLNPVALRDGNWEFGVADKSISYHAERSSRCAARGNYAGYFEAHNLMSWGINWTAVFHYTSSSTAVPYSAKGYGGVSFWMAFSKLNPTAFPVRVGISTMDTAWNGGICVSPNCSDHYLSTVEPDTQWRQFHVRFSDMKQIGYGDPLVPTMRKDQMVGFVIWPTQAFDLWVDDVRFEP